MIHVYNRTKLIQSLSEISGYSVGELKSWLEEQEFEHTSSKIPCWVFSSRGLRCSIEWNSELSMIFGDYEAYLDIMYMLRTKLGLLIKPDDLWLNEQTVCWYRP